MLATISQGSIAKLTASNVTTETVRAEAATNLRLKE